MVSESTLSSRVSLISLDPALASHITGTTRGTTIPATSQNGSSPRKATKTPETDMSRRHIRNNSAPSTSGKKRSNSLRRAKNSTEVLRQRSAKSSKKAQPLETVPDTREGRNFTVGNVGTGGVLYLTPSAHQSPHSHPPGMLSPAPLNTPITAPALLGNGDPVVPAHVKASSNPSISSHAGSTSTKRFIRASNRRVAVPNHGRSQSFSTLEEHRQSLTASKSRTLKIVINRPDTARPPTTWESPPERPTPLLPTLEVPIPHYRIGTFRFSSQGTPMLRNSSYTHGSVTPSDVTPAPATMQADQYFGAAPPASSVKASEKLEAAPMAQAGDRPDVKTRVITASKSTSTTASTMTNPVQPEVFDELTAMYDDPSIVRYCQNVREITAATPARIIAQISSDSFMDYELVSDFFLTFRLYMSAYSVLDLLLARLRWAIGRLEEDGRIIRVRAFAALRHWILNYFMDDFFVDRRLRVRFCAEINKLYADVKASPDNGFSDLKLLKDLKRCWNGRCSLCWDPDDFELDGDQEEDIKPGGVVDSERTPKPPVDARHVQARPETPQTEVLRGTSHSWFEADPGVNNHPQSAASDKAADSLLSDGSVQANSCFPPKVLLLPTADTDVYSKGPHPVSVQSRRKNAPANLHVVTQPTLAPKPLGHRKGAGSIDSNREPTPRKTDAESPSVVAEDGNIIRGLLYSPSAPFVQIMSSDPNSTPSWDRNETGVMRGGSRREHGTHSTQPVGRNIFGSLRKVLGNKHGQVDMTLLSVSQSAQDVPIRGQKSQLPLNISKSHDELRPKAGPAMTRKGEIRIDLLCAAVCQNYETKFPTKHRITYGAFFATHPPLQPATGAEGEMKTPRLVSDTTAQSGSILIVDDTGLDLPSMSGALPAPENGVSGQQAGLGPLLTVPNGHSTAPADRNGSIDAVRTQRSSNVLGNELGVPSAPGSNDSSEHVADGPTQSERQPEDQTATRSATDRPQSPTTTSSRTVQDDNKSLDVPQPVGNAAPAEEPSPLTGPVGAQEEDKASRPNSDTKLPAHTLRRRPGGNLRRVENVQDLDHAIHRVSIDTVSAGSDSPHESLFIMKTETANRSASPDVPPPNKPVSMINTHSSQHLRPSFEAAVAGFSAIPDDEDGGLEATLMKLEGRYEKKSPPMDQHPLDTTGKRRSLPDLSSGSARELKEPVQPASLAGPATRPIDNGVRETVNEVGSEMSDDGIASEQAKNVDAEPSPARRSSIYGLPTESIADSEDSEGSLPLLKRETAHESAAGPPPPVNRTPEAPAVAPGYLPQDPPQLFHLPKGPPPSGNKNRNSPPRPSTANDSTRSFLLDEDENLSDLSSEISVDIINYSGVAGRSISPMLAAPGTAISGLEIPAHPLTYASVVNLNIPEASPPQRVSDPVPQTNGDNYAKVRPRPDSRQPAQFQESSSSQPLGRLPAGPAHIPFVLACDSQVLAQQMTLVEKSALCEVEWSDLVEMRWDNKSAEVLDWVDCLTNGSIRGIDLVITRFNLVVKWALSEIVLTQDIQERARVITKYIHVAAHARRLHNYATMLQLTIALTSTDCTRLSKTWSIVSAPDKSLLKHMDALVQPIRNFHDLRLEMESADLSDGCIPFIGLYVHDLTYNAQKPPYIPTGQGAEPLVNFERYRTAAIIVKGLLRLIDASSRYNFEAIPGVIERCLWLAALGDDRIRSASRALEN
ncbi:uncharacterized protein Z518_07007 [Rhinocladiella mackenziei CBS 650.93]|uniref:Guanine nucleotide exchange factor n=1 Tax=Rhinocladiella mackenziei CBS 650.93 TaxID=1442369 RepID=A0A0D2J3C9_9EURO|nr:uncharacterized protein Z518_07007 [Rhinocladiella mackenziei CBS 650.93]KIX03455.1 hypothetical protein Z518_07007 [Rhinocladiella mackenziei CBS 650.93]